MNKATLLKKKFEERNPDCKVLEVIDLDKKILKVQHSCGAIKEKTDYEWYMRTGKFICSCNHGLKLKSINNLQNSLDEKFGKDILTVVDHTCNKKLSTFRFNKCKHEIKTSYNKLKKIEEDNLTCPICNPEVSDKYEVRSFSKNIDVESLKRKAKAQLPPMYSAGNVIRSTSGCPSVEVICNDCNKVTSILRSEHLKGQVQFRAKCSCETFNQKHIAENCLNLMKQGKVERLNKYFSVDDLKEIHSEKLVEYNIDKSLNKDLQNLEYIHDTLPQVKINLPFKKINVKLKNYIFHEHIELIEINAIKVNNLIYVNTVIEAVYKTKRGLNSCYLVLRNNKLGFLSKKNVTNIKAMQNAINIIEYITNLQDNKKKQKYINVFNQNTYYQQEVEEGETGIVDHKLLIKDTKSRYLYINQGYSTKRKIRASYTVSGHYRHYRKSNKKIFINSFEKGKQYRHIRRIEKNYKLK